MDCLSPILEIGTRLWDCSSKHVAYIHSLEENLQKLRAEVSTLSRRQNDVRRRVEAAEQQPRMRRTEDVDLWLTSAETTSNEANAMIEEGEEELRKKCFGNCCPKNMKSTYKIGKRVIKMIDSVMELQRKAELFYSDSAIVLRLPRKRLLMPEWPLENTVGLDSAVEKVWKAIEDGNVRIIRLCGRGGVGKTTLLKKVSNEFHRQSHDFDTVIWAKVPREEGYIEKVQEVIRKKLDIPDEIWNQCSCKDEKGAQIYSVLSGKKFVLLLDNVWEGFDLLRLGIHLRDEQNQSKVIFTACSLRLYLNFGIEAQVTIEVECLPPEQALSLFRMTVGESVLSSDPDLSKLANTFVRKCGGLPLALLTFARAIACLENPREWRHTIELSHTHPSEIELMGGYVFPLLKFSYDNLKEIKDQDCFLYCCLFPEDYNIRIDELIDLWVGEGFLDGTNPCDRGAFTVGTLKSAYLLETDESKQCVRMHDIIRHMALWLARDQERKKNKVLVATSGRLTDQELTKWEEANWISLFGCISTKVNISRSPSCPYLTTLLLRDGQLKSFPGGFFDSMPALKVLDLKGNQGLVELPSDIENARTLQYLNLSFTSLAKLPAGLGNLRNLKCLLLDYTLNLKWVPSEVISNLLLLQVYSKINGVTDYSVERSPSDEIAFLEVLECLNHINKIGITIFNAPSWGKLSESYTLRSSIRKLTFMECTGLISLHFTEEVSNLESLEIFRCSSLKEFNVSEGCKLGNLSKVCIGVCPLLLNLNSLAYARNLESLTIFYCKSLKEVTSEKIAFPRLKTISLTRLRNLKRICPSSRCFPSLLEIEVTKCPWLRQLPLDLQSANFLQKIIGETEWWDDLIWDDEAIKDVSRLKFVSTAFELLQLKNNHTPTFRGTSSYQKLLFLDPSAAAAAAAPPPPPQPETLAEILIQSGTKIPQIQLQSVVEDVILNEASEPGEDNQLNLEDIMDVWRLLRNLLPTKATLFARHISPNDICPRCLSNSEDLSHAFLLCNDIDSIWSRLGFVWPQVNDQKEFADVVMNFIVSLPMDKVSLLLITLWSIWNGRNKFVHESIRTDVATLHRFVTIRWKESLALLPNVSAPYPTPICHWEKPTGSWYKLNFDAGYSSSTGVAGWGAVIRDSQGHFMAAISSFSPHVADSFTAEAIACREAISFAIDSLFFDVIIEGDSLNTIKRLKSSQPDFSLSSPIMLEARSLLTRLRRYNITHVARVGNAVAHALAHHGSVTRQTETWFEEPPDFLHSCLMADSNP